MLSYNSRGGGAGASASWKGDSHIHFPQTAPCWATPAWNSNMVRYASFSRSIIILSYLYSRKYRPGQHCLGAARPGHKARRIIWRLVRADLRLAMEPHEYWLSITFASAVGLSNCHGAPRLRFFAGRPNATAPAPDGLVPAPWHSVDQILTRMADAGFSAYETVALLAAHSIATPHTIDPMAEVGRYSIYSKGST